MPCYDPRPEDYLREEASTERTKRRKVEAMLCGILTFLSENTLQQWPPSSDDVLKRALPKLNYKEMGVTRAELEQWWKQHQAEDRRRHQLPTRKAIKRKSKSTAKDKRS